MPWHGRATNAPFAALRILELGRVSGGVGSGVVPRLIHLNGPPGIGKSTLASAACRKYLEGMGSEIMGHGQPPLRPVISGRGHSLPGESVSCERWPPMAQYALSVVLDVHGACLSWSGRSQRIGAHARATKLAIPAIISILVERTDCADDTPSITGRQP